MPQTLEERTQQKVRFVEELKVLPVAVQTAAANEQHYEVRGAHGRPLRWFEVRGFSVLSP